MSDVSGNHPSHEALAEFAEGQSQDQGAIEAHLDACEACALEMLAGRDVIAFEALGTGALRTTPDFQARMRRELLAATKAPGSSGKGARGSGALGVIGLLGGFGGFGSPTAGPERMVAGSDHPQEAHPQTEHFSGEGEIPGRDSPSHSTEDDVTRMLHHLRHVLGDEVTDHHHPGDSTDHDPIGDLGADRADSMISPADDVSLEDQGNNADDDSSDAVDHDDHYDHGPDHGHDHLSHHGPEHGDEDSSG